MCAFAVRVGVRPARPIAQARRSGEEGNTSFPAPQPRINTHREPSQKAPSTTEFCINVLEFLSETSSENPDNLGFCHHCSPSERFLGNEMLEAHQGSARPVACRLELIIGVQDHLRELVTHQHSRFVHRSHNARQVKFSLWQL